jgi:hypothetical protein
MKNLSRISLLAAFGIASALAQVTTPSTTSCAAISAAATTVCLTSIANVAAGQTYLYLDSELMQTIGTPTNANAVKVARGAQVWIGLTPSFSVVPGVNGFSLRANLAQPQGTCVRASQVYLPIIYPGLGLKFDCDINTGVWRQYLMAGPVVAVTDNGANNAIASPVGSQPLYTGLVVAVTLAHSEAAGANTFAYAGGAALAIRSSFNPANNIATAYVATGLQYLSYAVIAGTGTWLDINQ